MAAGVSERIYCAHTRADVRVSWPAGVVHAQPPAAHRIECFDLLLPVLPRRQRVVLQLGELNADRLLLASERGSTLRRCCVLAWGLLPSRWGAGRSSFCCPWWPAGLRAGRAAQQREQQLRRTLSAYSSHRAESRKQRRAVQHLADSFAEPSLRPSASSGPSVGVSLGTAPPAADP